MQSVSMLCSARVFLLRCSQTQTERAARSCVEGGGAWDGGLKEASLNSLVTRRFMLCVVVAVEAVTAAAHQPVGKTLTVKFETPGSVAAAAFPGL